MTDTNIISKTPKSEKKSLVSDESSSKSEVDLWDSGLTDQRNDIEQNEEEEEPIELKLEEFDENDPDMDPVSFHKYFEF